jgi:hypothetical protein
MELTLKILNAAGSPVAQNSAQDEVVLVHRSPYVEGDRVVIEARQAGCFLLLSFDEALAETLVYLAGPIGSFTVPFGDRCSAFSPKAFSGSLHRLKARLPRPDEIAARRNLALNPFDGHGNSAIYPHSHATVETRQEAAFAARNAIDGETANHDHGFWPFTSWGINGDPDAALTVEFGRPVWVDEVVIYLRADFPHDAWWNRASLAFSDGGTVELKLIKTAAGQRFAIEPRVIDWAMFHKLVKADDPSPFPALAQIQFWGREVLPREAGSGNG